MITKVCTKCKIEKNENEFSKNKRTKDGLECRCKECEKQYREDNKEKLREQKRQYHQENREEILEKKKQYGLEHKKEKSEYDKKYRLKNKEKRNKQRQERLKNDICFKLRKRVSSSIRDALKCNQGGKQGGSVLKFLPFSIQQLKDHLEFQFESWMSWENHGNYDFKRDTWQIDHIIPHSSFHYQSMDCEEFRKCWALENLRPLKAIDNIKKGNRK
jgi:hypothetical protein